jgi:hypothetical protein
MYTLKQIHPFPARMAPDVALKHVCDLPPNAVVADPMCGSGTVLRVAAERGRRCVGFDLDPLAVLMSRVWTTPIDLAAVKRAADELVITAKEIVASPAPLPWIDGCEETLKFIERWFEPRQRAPLRALAYFLAPKVGPVADLLRIALRIRTWRTTWGASTWNAEQANGRARAGAGRSRRADN